MINLGEIEGSLETLAVELNSVLSPVYGTAISVPQQLQPQAYVRRAVGDVYKFREYFSDET